MTETTQRQKLAVIGTGIAGMGCAWFLHQHFDITVFEQDNYTGGHTNTVFVPEGEKNIPIDTGFIVCNNENYPLLMKLFGRLQVPLKKTSMSFAADILHDQIQYCGSSLNLLFAQRKNLFSPRYLRFLYQLSQFNTTCLEVIDKPELQQMSIVDYVRHRRWHRDLLNWYLLPMSSALWSTPPETSEQFPALALVRFFKNHGFLGLNTQFQWYTVDGGSEVYKQKLIAPFQQQIRNNTKIASVSRQHNGVQLKTMHGETLLFDKVVIATHADQALAMLTDATTVEKEILSPFRYSKNIATLHTDSSVMPSLKKIWSSWNYRIEKINGRLSASCTYWMNSLQGVSDTQDYFVTINDTGAINKQKVIREIAYEHPIFDVPAMQMQQRLSELNNEGPLYFCGSYFRYGFHEDAFRSAVEVCSKIRNGDVWETDIKTG